ncbi:MAG TPA: phage tail protein [Vicinamibacterales bacterium]|nr:phage tail protein [Vicinamibacterales bacterium]
MAVLRDDPYSAVNFQVVIIGVLDDGQTIRGSFAEVSGLDVSIAPIEYRTGSEDVTVRKIPGLKSFSTIVLRRGVIGDLTLWAWIKSALDGQVQRADGTITLLDESRQPVLTWKFRRAWPCKWTGPRLNAKGNGIAIETLELCHEGLEVE